MKQEVVDIKDNLLFLIQRKWVLASVIWVITSYLIAKNRIWQNEAILILWLTWLIFWSKSIIDRDKYIKEDEIIEDIIKEKDDLLLKANIELIELKEQIQIKK